MTNARKVFFIFSVYLCEFIDLSHSSNLQVDANFGGRRRPHSQRRVFFRCLNTLNFRTLEEESVKIYIKFCVFVRLFEEEAKNSSSDSLGEFNIHIRSERERDTD